MADAFEMAEDGNASFRLHPRHQAFAAARYDQINGTAEARQHFSDAGAVGCGRHLNCGGGQPCGFETLLQGLDNEG